MKQIIFIVFISQILCSCASVSDTAFEYDSPTSFRFQANDTIGVFYNHSESSEFYGASLWATLNPGEKELENWKELEVRIYSDSLLNLNAELIANDTAIQHIVLEGQLYDNSYLVKTKKSYKTIVILAVFTSNSAKLALTENNELLTLRQSSGILLLGGVVPIFGAAPIPMQIAFKEKKL